MYGQITKYRADLGVGVIRTEDGRKFRFGRRDIMNASSDMLGQSVDFVLVARKPAAIIMMAGSPWTAFGG